MTAAVIVLASVCIFLLITLFMQTHILNNIRSSLKRINTTGSRENLHSVVGTPAEKNVINEINTLLDAYKDERAMYKRKRHDLDQMMTNISHDLRTPLTSAIAYVDLMKRGNIGEEDRAQTLEVISEKLDRLYMLTDSFFEFSKIISNDAPPELESINLVAVLEDSIVGFFDNFSNSDRQIVFNHDGNSCVILSNKIMLLRVFDNIIGNAYKHGKGTLNIDLDNEGKTIVFRNEIADDENLTDASHVFDEFYTTDVSRTKGSTGLGLAIAKQFILILGGKISAEARDYMFTITIEL
ncbi:Signal transduction histidine kinase [Oscillospiraceae bacterium]|nr:Signal transduction histidine kinase [Oscillospiraceae bacterium]